MQYTTNSIFKKGDVIIPSLHNESFTKTKDQIYSSIGSSDNDEIRITAQEITELNDQQRQITENLNSTMKNSTFHGFKDK